MPRRSPSLLLVHVVWSTERRRPLLPASFDPTLADMMGDSGKRLGCSLLAAGCAPDHVHVLVRLAPVVALAQLVQAFKGASAYEVNRENRLGLRLTWQAGYWAESAPADGAGLVRYIRQQRLHHDDAHPAEQWQRESAEGGLQK